MGMGKVAGLLVFLLVGVLAWGPGPVAARPAKPKPKGGLVEKETQRLRASAQKHLKDVHCPACKSDKISAILYGAFFQNPAVESLVKEKLFFLGGRGIEDDGFYCNACQKKFHFGKITESSLLPWGITCVSCHRMVTGQETFWDKDRGTLCFKCQSLIRGWE